MSNIAIFVSGTIVLFFAHLSWASPTNQVPENSEPEKEWPAGQAGENLSISNAPPVSGEVPKADPGFYPYRQALTFRVGQASKFPKMNSGEFVFGFQYLFPKFLSPKLEAGADLHENGRGHVHAGLRWYWREKEYFRPSYKISADHLVDAKENLATLTQLENYYVRLSGTLEYVFSNPWSVRLEPELLVGFANQRVVITLGLSRGW